MSVHPDDTLSLPIILAWLRVNGGKIILGGVIVMLIAFPMVWFRAKTYQSSATLLVFPPAFKALDTTRDVTGNISEMMPQALPMELYRAIALSPSLLAEVIEEMPLDNTNVQQLQGRLSVELVQMGGRTAQGVHYAQALILNARAQNPQEAADTVDTWARVFKENVDALSAKGVNDTFTLLESLHATTREELERAAEALAEHKKVWNLALVQAQLEAKYTQYTKLEELLKQREVDLASSEKELETLKAALAEEPEVKVYFRAPSDDAYWAARLQQGEVNIVPDQGLRTELPNENYVRTRLALVEVAGETEGYRGSVEAIRTALSELGEEISALRVIDAERSVERGALERDLDSLKESYAAVRAQYEKGRMADRTQASDIAIAGKAVVPSGAVGGSGLMVVLSAFVLGLMATAGLLAAKDITDAARPLLTRQATNNTARSSSGDSQV